MVTNDSQATVPVLIGMETTQISQRKSLTFLSWRLRGSASAPGSARPFQTYNYIHMDVMDDAFHVLDVGGVLNP